MSLHFVLGASGSGKSIGTYKWIIEEAVKHPERTYMILVPDQFTMQIQKQVVLMHPGHAILNIDILSFSRLYHRVMEKLGGDRLTPLDDTGKNLILRKLAGSMKEELPVLGRLMDKQGYISEVKGIISEFQQYGISPEGMNQMIADSANRRGLQARLEDIQKLYGAYMDYQAGSYRTSESMYPILTGRIKESGLLTDTILFMDGFTGFTPVQMPLIQELLLLAKEVFVAITIAEEPGTVTREQQLFFTSAKTIRDLEKSACLAGVEIAPYIWYRESVRYNRQPALAHLERNLFRVGQLPYEEETEAVRICQAATPRRESMWVANEILSCIRNAGYQYRDIGVICGDVDGYRYHLQEAFAQMDIPYFLDVTSRIIHNPAMELLQGLLEILDRDFAYTGVLRYLRSGFSSLTQSETDQLEIYLIETGLRGRKAFSRPFLRKSKDFSLEKINQYRERLMEELAPCLFDRAESTRTYIEHLYRFMTSLSVEARLQGLAEEFEAGGDFARAREYRQIYRKLMDLFNQMVVLMGDEVLSPEQFQEILQAGFEELKVGLIPAKADQVMVGDMERTRFHQVKVLFVVGVNDTNIPGSNTKGGMISDIDREYLSEGGVELAPTTRQLQFRQRFYLYQQLTKASERLYLSYAALDNAEKEIRASYFIGTICKLFPKLEIITASDTAIPEHISVLSGQCGDLLRRYIEGSLKKEDEAVLYEMVHTLQRYGYGESFAAFMEQAFLVAGKERLQPDIARALYGSVLYGSISRLERYAACPYSHFLQYGMGISEHKEYVLESADLGNIFHDVLAGFGRDLEKDGYSWKNFPIEYGEARIDERLEVIRKQYGEELLLDKARNGYALSRAERILKRSVFVLQKHMQAGGFQNYGLELDFDVACEWNATRELLMRLQGRIDRVDVAAVEDDLYVKVIDYKSGNKQLALDCMYAGLQMQLIVYMDSATRLLSKRYPEKKVHPAAMFYYRVADPVADMEGAEDFEALPELLLKEQRSRGMLNGDERVVHLLDSEMENASNIIPLSLKKDGSPARGSQVCGEEQFILMERFIRQKIHTMGKEIATGHIEKSPYVKGRQEDGCEYCPYKGVCGFDEKQAGYEKREIESLSPEEVWTKMQEYLQD